MQTANIIIQSDSDAGDDSNIFDQNNTDDKENDIENLENDSNTNNQINVHHGDAAGYLVFKFGNIP